jgi:hypothetical protein
VDELPENMTELAAQRAVGKRGSRFPGIEALEKIPPPGAGPALTMDQILNKYADAYRATLVKVPYAAHLIIPSAVEERCSAREFQASRGAPSHCGEHATHKLGEEGSDPQYHNLTAYVCCEHFRSIMGRCTPGG